MSAIKLRMPCPSDGAFYAMASTFAGERKGVTGFTRHDTQSCSITVADGKSIFVRIAWKSGFLSINVPNVKRSTIFKAAIADAPEAYIHKLIKLAKEE
jgi:hypothetical protein